VFRRSSAGATDGKAPDSQNTESTQGTDTPEAPAKSKPPAQVGKGRPTPKRSDAEATRYRTVTGSRTSGRGPAPAAGSTPKRKRTPEEKARDRAEWNKRQLAMRNGEDWALGPRDKGPAKKLVRDYVDGHRRPSEYYMYALVLLILALVAGKSDHAFNSLVQIVLIAIIAVIVVDAVLLRRTILKLVHERLPKESTRGLAFYGIMRALQLRRFRMPAPRVKPGAEV
jgi:hypothetical protein